MPIAISPRSVSSQKLALLATSTFDMIRAHSDGTPLANPSRQEAMARRRKRSLTGRVFSEATRTLPAPLQFALATPTRTFVTVAVIGAAMSYGLVSIQWQNGRPSIKLDEQKAAQLKEKGIDWVQHHEGELQERIWGGDDEDAAKDQGLFNPFNKAPTAPQRAPLSTANTPRTGRVGIRRD